MVIGMKIKKGQYYPINPKKYAGNVHNIYYRSGLELSVMKYLDTRSDVIAWASEELFIPYICETDKQRHRYFPDFLIKVKQKNGNLKTFMIEVKPYRQTITPKAGKKKRKTLITEVLTYTKNTSKWQAARAYCASRGWEFKIITERDIANYG